MLNPLVVIFSIFGLLIGSFLNALIYRLPLGKNIAYPGSGCPHCGHLIRWYENIPLLSFLFLKGKCSNCSQKISWQYPFVEFISMLVAYLLSPTDLNPESLLTFFFLFTVYCSFMVHFVVDLRHQLLPDPINIYLGLLFLIVSVISFNWLHWAIGFAVGLGFPLLVSWIFYQLKGEVGLGGGDIKLFGVLGLYLGPIGIIQNIFLSCFLGALIGLALIAIRLIKKENPIPFGPFILIVASFQIFLPTAFSRLISYIP